MQTTLCTFVQHTVLPEVTQVCDVGVQGRQHEPGSFHVCRWVSPLRSCLGEWHQTRLVWLSISFSWTDRLIWILQKHTKSPIFNEGDSLVICNGAAVWYRQAGRGGQDNLFSDSKKFITILFTCIKQSNSLCANTNIIFH